MRPNGEARAGYRAVNKSLRQNTRMHPGLMTLHFARQTPENFSKTQTTRTSRQSVFPRLFDFITSQTKTIVYLRSSATPRPRVIISLMSSISKD